MILIVYVVLLLRLDIRAFSIDSFVQFICKGCVPKPNNCCIGTAVSPKHYLTTNYCAESCQYVKRSKEEFQIKKVLVNPFPKTYVINNIFVGPNTIALVETEISKNSNYSYIKLGTSKSFVDTSASIIVFDDVPKFRKAKIIQCEEGSEFLNSYYVCAADDKFEGCDIPQGSPLFSNEQLLGITGIQNFRTCQYTKRAFLALEPAIFWIQYILSDDLIINMQRQNNTIIKNKLRKKKSIGSTKKNKRLQNSTSSNKNHRTKTYQTISNKVFDFHKMKINLIKKKINMHLKGKRHFNTTKSNIPIISRQSSKQKTKKMKFMRTKIHEKYFNNKVSKDRSSRNYHVKWTSKNKIPSTTTRKHCSRPKLNLKAKKLSKTSDKKMSKNITSTGPNIKLRSLSLHTTKSLKLATTLSTKNRTSKISKVSKVKKVRRTKNTNAMEWFHKMRNKTYTDEPQILVLTTSRVPLREFIDLT